ncbi:glycerol-3-phosphate phosphatase-like isoform X2 [Oscarella lobularis]|uniref:glycerol-3-phosphate phosphatase-like isoform X2 n=1 Tax=Oscarella lobularis TaxID=121494 RepID=UPI003314168C
MACEFLSENARSSFVDSVDTFLIDCDGVLWHGNDLIDGANRTIQSLRSLGKRLFFVTNNSTKSRLQYSQKFDRLGMKATPEEVISTAYASAQYLKGKVPSKGKVYLIGSTGLIKELDEAGISYIGTGPDPVSGDGYRLDEWAKCPLDPEVKCVLVGFDEHFSFIKMLKAASYLRNPDCIFIGTNEDSQLPLKNNQITIPGTGCMVSAVAMASNREPIYVGKPHQPMFEILKQRHEIDPDRTCMIGDTVSTDIAFGKNNGLKTLLVMTGSTDKAHLEMMKTSKEDGIIRPDYYLDSITQLA